MAKENEVDLPALQSDDIKTVARLQDYNTLRNKVMKFVREKLVDGVDYGLMYDRAEKPSLLKPGAEKICMLFQIEPVFVADKDTWDMIGSLKGNVVLKCYLLDTQRKLMALKMIKELGKENEDAIFKMLAISEGRGAGSMNERSNMDSNSLVKIVEKRSLVDAVLRVAGLSEMYTQDGENIQNGQQNGQNSPQIPINTPQQPQETYPKTEKELEEYLYLENKIREYISSDSFPASKAEGIRDWLIKIKPDGTKEYQTLEFMRRLCVKTLDIHKKAQVNKVPKKDGFPRENETTTQDEKDIDDSELFEDTPTVDNLDQAEGVL